MAIINGVLEHIVDGGFRGSVFSVFFNDIGGGGTLGMGGKIVGK